MSKLTKQLAILTKKLKWPENKSVGYTPPDSSHKFLNPLLSPPPRSPRTVEDFKNPGKLGHWVSYGLDWANPKADKWFFHEMSFLMITGTILGLWFWAYAPDARNHDWARREAYLRTHQRELLGLPLVDKDVVDPERVVLPTEEELQDFPVTM